MDKVAKSLFAELKINSTIDDQFYPLSILSREYNKALLACKEQQVVSIALERQAGLVSKMDISIFPSGTAYDAQSAYYIERLVKFQLWAKGGWKIYISGPDAICSTIKQAYSVNGARAFDVDLMSRVYGKPFEVVPCKADEVPDSKEESSQIGGHLDGCRIGFDLGASDYKLAAVKDGEAVFSTEIPWNPKDESDPAYHYKCISEGLKLAASHLPQVDAIGGSSAGVYIDNCPRVASLFRSVSEADFQKHIAPMFLNIQKEWDVPFVIINDGDVTALAGGMSLGKQAMLGIAMGSSEAVGYLDRQGNITGWLNELAFAPVDAAQEAAKDEWSKDIGVGAMYFSQQAVNKLALISGYSFEENVGLPRRLEMVQEKLQSRDENAHSILETIGIYLGYSLPFYALFYDFENVLVLGRVSSAGGGDIIIDNAKQVLKAEFPEMLERVSINVPDEKSRRVGQAIAAASLPEIN